MIKSRIVFILLLFFIVISAAENGDLSEQDFQIIYENTLKHVRKTNTGVYSENSIKIIVLKTEFQIDDNPFTSGNGKMDLNTDPPHNQEFFENKFKKAEKYFETVSNNRFSLEYTIMPNDDTLCYKMPNTTGYYGSEEDWETRLVELFRDAVLTADSVSNINWNEYESVVVLYAGPPDATDIFGDSPEDISTAYIPTRDLIDYLGYSEQGIPVSNGYVKHGSLLSEDPSQDTYLLGGLGETANQICHILGLPDLYDTNPESNGIPRIGQWGLMDFGQWNANGYSPSYPSAWSLYQMGWRDIITVEKDTSISIRAVENLDSKIVKVPINSEEYFLISNRQQDKNLDGVFNNYEYDFKIPGSGLMIWHVDETAVNRYIDENLVNAYLEDKGVDLEEADGINDLDQQYTTFSSPYDPFFEENVNSFTPFTFPDTKSKAGCYTGIFIENISANDTIMNFNVSFREELSFESISLDSLDKVLAVFQNLLDKNTYYIAAVNGFFEANIAEGSCYQVLSENIDNINHKVLFKDKYIAANDSVIYILMENNIEKVVKDFKIQNMISDENFLYLVDSNTTYVYENDLNTPYDILNYSITNTDDTKFFGYRKTLSQHNLTVFEKSGAVIHDFSISYDDNVLFSFIRDVNNDSVDEIVVVLTDEVKIFDSTSYELLYEISLETTNLITYRIFNDSQLSFIWTEENCLFFTDFSGINYPNFPYSFESDIKNVFLVRTENEKELIVVEKNKKIHRLSMYGKEKENYPISTGYNSLYSEIISSADHNSLNIFSENNDLYSYNLWNDISVIWGKKNRNQYNNPTLYSLAPDDSNIDYNGDLKNPILYPNPVEKNEELFVRYFSDAAFSDIVIYDLHGSKVKNIGFSNIQNSLNEHMIDVKDLSTGVYIMKFNNGDKTDIIKFSIIK